MNETKSDYNSKMSTLKTRKTEPNVERKTDYSFIRKTFGNKLIELRKSKGLKQEDLARILGISRVALSHYERGERKPDIEVVYMVAEFFDIPIDYLFGNGSKKKREFDIFDIGFSDSAIDRFTGEPALVTIINKIIEHPEFQKIDDLLYMNSYQPLINEYETSYYSFLLSQLLYSILVDVMKDMYDLKHLSGEEKANLIVAINEYLHKEKEINNLFYDDPVKYYGRIDTTEEDLKRILKKIKSTLNNI